MTLGEQIVQLRRQKKISQEELATALDVSRQAVSKWENGVSNPDTENLVRIAEVFEVDVNVLIGCQLSDKKQTDASSPHKQQPDQQKTVRLLSIFLAISVCTAVLFGTLWAVEKFIKEDMPVILENESSWDSVKLYKYVAFKPVEVTLSEKDQDLLASLVWSYPFSKKEEKAPISGYGGIMVDLELAKNGVTYYWTFRPNAISCSIQLADGNQLICEYEPDQQLFDYLGYFY